MYNHLKTFIVRALRVPPEPDDPMGDADMLKVFRASPNYYRYKLLVWLIRNLIGLPISLIFYGFLLTAIYGGIEKSLGAGRAMLLCLGLLLLGGIFYLLQMAFSYILLRLDYEMRWYKVTDRSLRIREGVVLVREMTMTFANIQNISFSQGPLQRLLGIGDLRVETAGGGARTNQQQQQQQNMFSMHVGFFRGIDNYEEIRDLMVRRLKRYRDAGLGDDSGEESENAPGDRRPMMMEEVYDLLRGMEREAFAFRESSERLRAS